MIEWKKYEKTRRVKSYIVFENTFNIDKRYEVTNNFQSLKSRISIKIAKIIIL